MLLCQKNSAKLEQIAKKQDQLEAMIIEQRGKLDEVLSKFEEQKISAEGEISKKRGKDKGKKNKIEFYQVNMHALLLLFFVYSIFI